MVQTFATRAALKSGADTTQGVAFLTEGNDQVNGGRSGKFLWNATQPYSGAAKDPQEGWYLFPVTNQPGAWVRDAREGNWANHAGLVAGTGLSGTQRGINRDAIQAAIDIIIYMGRKGPARIPAGDFEHTGTIHLGYGEQYHACRLTGEGRRYGAITGSGTVLNHICPSFDVPQISIQGCRAGAGVSGMTLQGALQSAILAFATTYLTYASNSPPNFVTQSEWAALGGDSRYAPYAAITVDAYSGAKPTGGYPDVTYPSYSGISTQYGKNHSSAPILRDLEMRGYNTGFVNNPSNADGNGDFPTIEDTQFSYCMWMVSVGNTQCRNVHMKNIQWVYIYCCWTTNTHGLKNGRLGGTMVDCSGSATVKLFNTSALSITGGPTWINLYCETLWQIGSINNATSADGSLTFQGGIIALDAQLYFGPPAYTIEGGSAGLIVFDSVYFSEFASFLTSPSDVEYRNCTIQGNFRDSGTITDYKRCAYNTFAGGIFRLPNNNSKRPLSVRFNPVKLSTGAVQNLVDTGPGYSPIYWGRDYCLPYHVWELGTPNAFLETFRNKRRRIRPYEGLYDRASLTSCTRSGRTLTLVFAALSTADAMVYGQMPGDVIWDQDSGTLWIIKSRSGTTVVAEQQTNYHASDNEPYVPISTTAGYLYFTNCRQYSLSYETTGTATSGSGVVTAVARPDGSAAHLSEIQDGDVSANAYFDHAAFNSGAGSWVVGTSGVNTGAKTITLTGAAVQTRTNVPFNDWIRAPLTIG